MLIHLDVIARDRSEKRLGDFVLNTAFISELTNIDDVRFKYAFQPENPRGGEDLLTVDEVSVARIRTAINTDFVANAVTLFVYPQEDLDADTIPTVFNIAEIIAVWSASADTTTLTGLGFKSYMTVNHKGNVKRYLIDHHYLDLISYSETASTSTYTTS